MQEQWHLQNMVSILILLLLLLRKDIIRLSELEAETFRSPFHCLLLLSNCANAGEVFVLDDGGEADLDLGNYERYLDVTLSRDNNITTGKIYKEVIEKEVS
jgi:hypothetical protein